MKETGFDLSDDISTVQCLLHSQRVITWGQIVKWRIYIYIDLLYLWKSVSSGDFEFQRLDMLLQRYPG